MRIGLDWDGTVNADPACFREIVATFLDAGHDVAVVTWRPAPDVEPWGRQGLEYPDMAEVFAEWGFKIPVIYCNGRAKREFYNADVWIDDNPAAVCFSLTRPPRFESDASAYLKDMLVCERHGFDPVFVEWEQVRGVHQQPPIPEEILECSPSSAA